MRLISRGWVVVDFLSHSLWLGAFLYSVEQLTDVTGPATEVDSFGESQHIRVESEADLHHIKWITLSVLADLVRLQERVVFVLDAKINVDLKSSLEQVFCLLSSTQTRVAWS